MQIKVDVFHKINAFDEFLEGEGTFGTQNTHSMLDIK